MPCPKSVSLSFFPCHQFPPLSFLKYSTFSAVSGSFLANLSLTPPLFSTTEMFTSTPAQHAMPLPPGKFSKLALCASSYSSYYGAENSPPKIHGTTSLLFYKLNPCFKKTFLNSGAAVALRQPLVFYCFLEIGAACPEPAAATELIVPARQDIDAHGPGQCTPKCNNSLLFSTLPCWDSTLNSEELAHPKIRKKSLFVRVNMGHCYRKLRCYHSYTRS